MKIVAHILRLVVGVLFIVSGFVKLVDPMGFSFKLEEYFSEPVLNLPFLEPLALAIGLVVVIYELLLGVMLLVGYKPKFTMWSLLGMIVFFTFLTLYTLVTGKVTDCGCFGDALKLTPLGTFIKDVILLVLIVILLLLKKHIKPVLSPKFGFRVSVITLLGCVVLAYYVLHHLPVIDFRAFKVGNNITEKMSVPDDAPKPVVEYSWKMRVNGEEKIYKNTTGRLPDVDGEYVDVSFEEIEKGYEPPIHDFTMERDGDDYTEDMLNEPKLIIIAIYKPEAASPEGLKAVKEATDKALKAGYVVVGLSPYDPYEMDDFKEKNHFNFDFYFMDAIPIKTMVRANPGIVKVSNGTVIQKLNSNDADKLEL